MSKQRELIYGTCVAWGNRAALLRGRSSSGKSDLALRFIALSPEGDYAPMLVADDQIWVEGDGRTGLVASPPPAIAGKMEVRGLGLQDLPYLAKASLVLVVDLVADHQVPRMPPDPLERTTIGGVALPRLRLAPFEASSALKLKFALSSLVPD